MKRIFKNNLLHATVVFGSLLIVTVLSFNYNFFGFSEDNFYSGFQKDSESLVVNSIMADKFEIDKHNRGLGSFNGEACSILPNTECTFFLTDQNWIKGVNRLLTTFFVQNEVKMRDAIHVGNKVKVNDSDERTVLAIEQNGPYLKVKLSGEAPLSKFVNTTPLEFKIDSDNSNNYQTLSSFVDKPTFSNYDSQYGIQGRFYSRISKALNVYSIKNLELFTAIVTGISIVLLTLSYARIFNGTYASIFFAVLVSSPWIISFAPNLYWIPFSWFLPALVTALLYESINSSFLVRIILLASYGLLILIKCLAGYEYLSSIILFSTSVFIVAPLFKGEKIKKIHIEFFIICSILSVLAFCLALAIHANMRADNLIDGLKIILDQDVKRRTYGNPANFDPIYTSSLAASALSVVKTYILNWKTSIFFYLPGELFKILISSIFFIFTFLVINGRLNAYSRNFIIIGIYSLIPISWFVLAKGHSHIHTHMNYVLWYLGFIPMIAYYFFYEIRDFTFRFLDK